MTIFQKIRGLFTRDIRASTSNSFKKWFDPVNIWARLTSHTLASNETIYAAVSRLSNSMGSMPLKLLWDYRPITDHPVSEILTVSPNPNMTSFDFIRTLETCRNTSGNAYAMKDYDTRFRVKALWILDPSKVNPVVEKTTRELWYEVQGDHHRYYVHNMDMIHVKHIHTIGYKGISPLDVLKNSLEFDAKVKSFSLDQVESAVRASFILKMATHLDEGKKTEVMNSFRNFYKENGGVLIQEQGTEIDPIERKFLDTKVFEVEKITRTRVATVFNMPVHMLGETEGATYASREHMSLEYVQDTLIPIVRQYEQEFERKLLAPQERAQGLYLKFNVGGLLRGDMKTRSEFYFKGIRTGLLKPNEARAWEELPPAVGGDKLYMSRDLSPIDERKEGGNA